MTTAELETHLLICVELKYCDKNQIADVFTLVSEERKMLNGLRPAPVQKLTKKGETGCT